ncbi:DMT family transporter [Tessaracoccus terricola]
MPNQTPAGTRRPRVHPVLLVIVAIVTVQTGSSFAKLLFDEISPYGVTFLRAAFATVVLLLVAPPRLRGRPRADWGYVVGYGLCLAGMNLLFYLSIARIPIGLAVTLEFIGPLLLALRGAKRAIELGWVLLAALGVALLGAFPVDADLVGMVLAVAAGGCWAAYIILAGPVGVRWSGASGVTVATGIGAVVLLVPGLAFSGPELGTWRVLGLGLVVALLATVIPYGLEMYARRSIGSHTFGILMSLEPGAAALLAFLIVGEVLGWQEWVAMVCVVAASIGATWSAGARRRAAGSRSTPSAAQ